MKIKEIINNDYFKLFVKREGKVVLGKRYANLWLLCSVLFVTFLAIAFSNASLNYLSIKMNDPFINWVDIKNATGSGNDFIGFESDLQRTDIMEEYHFGGYQTDKYKFTQFFTKNLEVQHLDCRYFAEIKTPLVAAILNEENVVGNNNIAFEKLCNNSFGVIITQDALVNKLRYKNDEIPAYIYCNEDCPPVVADDFHLETRNDYANVPIPVLAVVHRLPTNMEVIGTKHLYFQRMVNSLNLDNSYYHSSFLYWLPKKVNIEEFKSYVQSKISECGTMEYSPKEVDMPQLTSLYDGTFVWFRPYDEDEVDFAVNRRVNDAVMEKFGDRGIVRLYDYDDRSPMEDPDDYISIHFNDLNKIGAFQQYAKEQFKINIEMSQINAKENFNEVSIMANILSWTMIVFAIVCIILFIVNLLQSYFQKVKRNLGTFKAFGIGNNELISVYVLIMIATVCVAIVLSLAVSFVIQSILPVLGILKDGTFNYIDLWSGKLLGSIIIIIAASVTTVYIVMYRLLKATPGDLIYDR